MDERPPVSAPIPEPAAESAEPTTGRRIGRRQVLGTLGAGVVGVGLGVGVSATGLFGARDDANAATGTGTIAFTGPHQAGISSAVQGHLHFASFDVTTSSRERLISLLQRWTAAARAMCAGAEIGHSESHPLAPPDDSGEAVGLPPSRLTITVGFGPSLFDGRFGLAARRPAALVDLPPFAGDNLDPAFCGGDLCLQACADDPQVAVHAIRNLIRIATGTAAVRWAQLGYGRAASTSLDEPTPRNLFGFKDGTANPHGTDTAILDEHVWVQPGDAAKTRSVDSAWITGGSYLVARRIAMRIETWDRTSLDEQERIFGRSKHEGASFGQSKERDAVDLSKLPADSHVALAHSVGTPILRRGYNYVDGSNALGHLDAGLFFLAYQRDPRRQFIPIQESLAASDTLNEYIQHIGSSMWAIPAGVTGAGYWGAALFA